jgi:drug/metabolite transporter (DMT)-like permease
MQPWRARRRGTSSARLVPLPQTGEVIAILGGLGAALLWGSATLTSSRAGRLIGPSATVAWMMLIGVAVATPLAIVSGPMPTLSPGLIGWMAGSGAGGVAGLMLVYRGLRYGQVGVVAALASTEGAIAAVVSVASGDRGRHRVGGICHRSLGHASPARSAGERRELG